MVCIHCGSKTSVINSRPQKRSNRIWRRRECAGCRAVFTTEETAAYNAAWLVKNNAGRLEPFSRDKLFLSLYKSCEHRKTALRDAEALTATVISRLLPQVSDGFLNTHKIVSVVQVALNRFDGAASVSYQAYHA